MAGREHRHAGDVVRYRLVVLTHGTHGRGDTLERTLGSFLDQVVPTPTEVYIHQDGPGAPHYKPGFPMPLTVADTAAAQGFCWSTRRAWRDAAASDVDYVFWLEHDFVFTQRVNLRELAAILDTLPMLAQMALCRGSANPAEEKAGGLVASRPGEFTLEEAWLDRFRSNPGIISTPHDFYARPWYSHSSYFTTNPSLMRRAFMAENPWPDYPEQCEGRFGIDLRELGYFFGLWGDGTPWVEHVGVRSGFGY